MCISFINKDSAPGPGTASWICLDPSWISFDTLRLGIKRGNWHVGTRSWEEACRVRFMKLCSECSCLHLTTLKSVFANYTKARIPGVPGSNPSKSLGPAIFMKFWNISVSANMNLIQVICTSRRAYGRAYVRLGARRGSNPLQAPRQVLMQRQVLIRQRRCWHQWRQLWPRMPEPFPPQQKFRAGTWVIERLLFFVARIHREMFAMSKGRISIWIQFIFVLTYDGEWCFACSVSDSLSLLILRMPLDIW